MSRGKSEAEDAAVSEAKPGLGAGRATRGPARSSARPSAELEEGRPRLWSIAEVAEYLQISINSIYKMTARKAAVRIPYIRIGGKLRFRPADVDRWLELLTVSNLDKLARVRQKALKVSHGHDSQTQIDQR
jgi:excisionase family DNA binding protein